MTAVAAGPEVGFPPRRTRALLESWVADFEAATHLDGARIHVAPQEDVGDLDTGLVIMRPCDSELSVYMQPRGFDDPLWELTIPGRDFDVTMTPLELGGLAAVVLEASRLCTYLQYRSLEWDRESGRRRRVSAPGGS